MHMMNKTLTEIFPTTSSNTLIGSLVQLNRNNEMKLCSLNHFHPISKGVSHTQMKRKDSKEMAQTQLSLQPDSHQKFADLLLIIQNLTYRVREMTVTMEFKSAHLLKMTNGEMPTYHIYTFTKS